MNYHDVLARLGVKNAHPGGQGITDVWMRSVDIPQGADILDVGCGNGDTACTCAKLWDCRVTALDIREKMVVNTRRRAAQRGVSVNCVCGSVESLPFKDHSFDVVICESVLVFVKQPKALKEIHRVLRPHGFLVDVEMMLLGPSTPQWTQEVRKLYGATKVPDLAGWKSLFIEHGFSNVKVLRSGSIRTLDMSDSQHDQYMSDPSAWNDARVLQILEANGRWLQENQNLMGYGVFIAKKG